MPAVLIESTRTPASEGREVYGYEIWQTTIPSGGTTAEDIRIGGYPKQVYIYNASSTTTGTIYVRLRHDSSGAWFQKSIGGTAGTYNLYGPYPVLGANTCRIYSGSTETADRTFYVIFAYY
jgi:hypothetical protein